jgi:uncharacterized protein involved in response to NO
VEWTDVSEVRTESIIIVLMMEAVCTSETLVHFNVTTRRYIPEESKLHVLTLGAEFLPELFLLVIYMISSDNTFKQAHTFLNRYLIFGSETNTESTTV